MNEQLHVMLQGQSAPAMRDLVVMSGGTLTHDLPIISAVGALLTQKQLDQVLESGKVDRYIDDLLITDQPVEEEKPEEQCLIAGALEINFTPDGISWQIYNQEKETFKLEKLELGWPHRLEGIESITFNGQSIPASLYREATETVTIALTASTQLVVQPTSSLDIHFQTPGKAPPLLQRELKLKASFGDDCSTSLVPGYHDNHENFHYSTVAGASELHQLGITGSGVNVAILDSGLWEHPALAKDTKGEKRIVARYNAITDQQGEEVFDGSGHGTHMSSVIAHSGKVTQDGAATGFFQGVAPDVGLVAVKALNENGRGALLDIVRAIQWVVDNRETYNIRVLNLSFASAPQWPYWLDPINQAVMQAWAAGIVIVAAAGNEGPEPMTIGTPGDVPYIITVGAYTDSWTPGTRDDDYIPDFSSRGPTPDAHIKPDVVAPGGHITGLTRPGSGLTLEHPAYILRDGNLAMTGSSQAAAVVSGIVALLLQLEPDLGPDEIKCKLTSSAEPAINLDGLLAYSPFQQGHGLVTAPRAITLGSIGCANQDMDLRKELAGEEHFEGPAIMQDNGEVSLPGLAEMLSPEPAAKGLSESRKWGVKEHIERPNLVEFDEDHPFNWPQTYLQEKARIEQLAQDPPR